MIYGLGALPSAPDSRDYTIDKTNIPMATTFPVEYTVKYLPDIYNQGSVGQCVAFSLAKIKEAQELKERGKRIQFSTSYIYANRDVVDYQGEGMYPREALKRLCRYGTSEHRDFDMLADYPTCSNAFKTSISSLLPLGIAQKVHGYVRLNTIEESQSFLINQDIPALITIDVYDNFYTPVNGVVNMPLGTVHGGHAMALCGWKLINNKQYWVVSNSWGNGWGDNGYCYLPFEFKLNEMWGVVDENALEQINKPQQISFTIGKPEMVVDEITIVKMDTSAQIIGGRTLVPVRFIAEALGYKVSFTTMANGAKIVSLQDGGLI